MDNRIVVTYKRKRLFSRSDLSNINLQSDDKPLEITEPKTLAIASANKNEQPIAEPKLQNKDEEIEIRHEHVKDKDGENMAQCRKSTSECSSQSSERATKAQKLLEGSQSHAEEKSNDNQSQLPLSVKSGLEHEDKSKEIFSNKLDKDQKPTLITFSRRSKRKREIAADSCSVDVKNEKIANLANTLISNEEKDSREKISSLQENICMDVQDNNNEKTPKKNSILALDLSTSPPAARYIDCNLPLDCGPDEDHRPVPLEVVHKSLGSTSMIEENIPNLQLQSSGYPLGPIVDKGKSPIDPLPVSTGTSKNNYLQLFPENKSNHAPWLPIDPQKAAFFVGPNLNPSSLHSSRFHGLSLQPDPMVNNHHPSYPLSYPWGAISGPNTNVQQPREAFQDFLHSTSQPFSRHKMMLDGILAGSRNVSGNRNTTWFEEELDCLWIGVRRHGKGNWDAMLRDPRLNFSPWKTTRDLSDRWQEEQNKLVYVPPPVSQVKYPSPSGLLNVKTNRLLQKPVMNNGPALSPYGHFGKLGWGLYSPSESNIVPRDESSSDRCHMKGNLPHWLREAVEAAPAPPGQMGPTQNLVYGNNNCGPQNCKKGPCIDNAPLHESRVFKQEDLVVIPSDSSSEETISDDRSIKL